MTAAVSFHVGGSGRGIVGTCMAVEVAVAAEALAAGSARATLVEWPSWPAASSIATAGPTLCSLVPAVLEKLLRPHGGASQLAPHEYG